jgi:hypothetical protein
VETEVTIRIQTERQAETAIIILAQDVIMDIVVAIMQGLEQVLIQAVIQTHRLNKQRHGEIIVIRVRLQRSRHQVVGHLMEAVHRRAEVVLQVAEVEVEVQDKINKTLTIKIPLNSNLRGFFRLKYRGIVIFNCHICS